MGLSGGQGCTHKSISLYCFCWGLGACIHQTKYYPSVFTISLSQTLFPSFKTLRFAVFIPLFSFSQHSLSQRAPWERIWFFIPCVKCGPGPVWIPELLQIICNRACAAGSTSWLCWDISVSCIHAGRESGHTLGSRQSRILILRITLGKKDNVWHRQRMT